jgi:hypothetical protein
MEERLKITEVFRRKPKTLKSAVGPLGSRKSKNPRPLNPKKNLYVLAFMHARIGRALA